MAMVKKAQRSTTKSLTQYKDYENKIRILFDEAGEVVRQATKKTPPFPPPGRPSDSPSNQLSEQLTGQPSDHPIDAPFLHPSDHPSDHPSNHPTKLFPPLPYNDPVFTITDKQATILIFLIDQETGIAQKKEMTKRLGIPEGTVKDSIRVLTKYRFISKPKKFHQGRFQGFSYTINKELCNRFLAQRLHHPTNHPTNHLSAQPTDQTPFGPSDTSSSSFNKTTTKKIETLLSSHPELGYWRQKGLTIKQLEQWAKITGGLENLIQSLCHCRFEMVDLGIEESKPIDNVFNWFFRIIERTGSYPKPKGYKSFEEKQIDETRKIVEERENRVQELKELSRKKYELEREEQFWTMMNDPEGDLYQQCYGNLNNFEKKTKGKAFEKSMRVVFDKVMDEKEEDA
jgi:hypothetical protein